MDYCEHDSLCDYAKYRVYLSQLSVEQTAEDILLNDRVDKDQRYDVKQIKLS